MPGPSIIHRNKTTQRQKVQSQGAGSTELDPLQAQSLQAQDVFSQQPTTDDTTTEDPPDQTRTEHVLENPEVKGPGGPGGPGDGNPHTPPSQGGHPSQPAGGPVSPSGGPSGPSDARSTQPQAEGMRPQNGGHPLQAPAQLHAPSPTSGVAPQGPSPQHTGATPAQVGPGPAEKDTPQQKEGPVQVPPPPSEAAPKLEAPKEGGPTGKQKQDASTGATPQQGTGATGQTKVTSQGASVDQATDAQVDPDATTTEHQGSPEDTRVEPLSLNLPPTILGMPKVDSDVDAHIAEQTGMTVTEHESRATERLQTLQGKMISRASLLQSQGDGLTGGLLTEIETGRSAYATQSDTTLGAIHGALDAATSTVIGASTAASSTVQTAHDKALSDIDGETASVRGQVTQLHVQKKAEFDAAKKKAHKRVESDVVTPAGAYVSTAEEVAGGYDKLDGELSAHFMKSGSAMDKYLGSQKASFAQKKAGEAKADMKANGKTRADDITGKGATDLRAHIDTAFQTGESQVEGLGHAGNTAADAARGQALQKAQVDKQTADAQIASAQTTAVALLQGTRTSASAQVSTLREEVSTELDTRAENARSAMEDAANRSQNLFGTLMEQATRELMPNGLRLLADFLPGFAVIEMQAEELFSSSGSELDALQASMSDDLATFLQQESARLVTLQGHYAAEAQGFAGQALSSLQVVGQLFASSQTNLPQQIRQDFLRWLAPQRTQLDTQLAGARAQADTLVNNAKAAVDTNLATTRKAWEQQVKDYKNIVAPAAQKATQGAQDKVMDRAKQAHKAMRGWGTDENGVFNALRGMNALEPGALREEFQKIAKGSLDSWLASDLTDSELKIANAHLALNHGEAARAELDYATSWFNDEAQVEAILRGLPDDEVAKIKNSEAWASTARMLESELGKGPDLDVANALMAGNKPKADAIRLKQKIDDARTDRNPDAINDELAKMDQKTREKIIGEFVQLEGVAKGVKIATDGSNTAEIMKTYIKAPVGNGNRRVKPKSAVTGAQADLTDALIDEGTDSAKAQAARIAIESKRTDGADKERLEKALQVPASISEGLHDPDPKKQKEAREALEKFQAEVSEQAKSLYGKDPKTLLKETKGLKNKGGDNDERKMFEMMLEDGTNSPRVAARQILIAVDGMGTDEAAIKRALNGLSPDEVTALREEYAKLKDSSKKNKTLDAALGLGEHKGWGSELSGQDANDVEVLLMGDEKYMDDDQKFKLAKLKYDQQNDGTGTLGKMLAGDSETEAMNDNFTELQDFREKYKDQFINGKFQGNDKEQLEYIRLCKRVGISAELYQASVDRAADYAANTLAIAAGVGGAIFTGGGSLAVAMAWAAGGTALNMASKAAIKGDRYGWEEVITDAGKGIVDVASAGVGGKLTKGLDNQFTKKVMIESSVEGVKTISQNAMDDATWNKGGWEGAEKLFKDGLKAGFTTAAGSKANKHLGEQEWMKQMSGSGNGFATSGASVISATTTGLASNSTGVAFDAVTGDFKGDFGDAVTKVGTDTTKNLHSKAIVGSVKGYTNKRSFNKAQQDGLKDGTLSEAEANAANAQVKSDGLYKANKYQSGAISDTKLMNDVIKRQDAGELDEGDADNILSQLTSGDPKAREKAQQAYQEALLVNETLKLKNGGQIDDAGVDATLNKATGKGVKGADDVKKVRAENLKPILQTHTEVLKTQGYKKLEKRIGAMGDPAEQVEFAKTMTEAIQKLKTLPEDGPLVPTAPFASRKGVELVLQVATSKPDLSLDDVMKEVEKTLGAEAMASGY